MPDTEVVLVLCAAALVAGWVDAVAGGGGLVQLPALLVLLPGAAPAQILATNKLSSVFGTATAAAVYARRVRPDLRTALALAVFIPQGAPMYGLGLSMAACNVLGGRLGAVAAISRGSRFVRVVFLLVVGVLTLRLAVDVLRGA
jgi:uncharacterized membrane protein YfcA